MRVVKSTYFSNWGDLFGYKIAAFFVPFLAKISFITPNIVTITAFTSYALGCILQLGSYHLSLLGGLMVFAGYIGDDIDGQLARITKKYSTLGDYLDKVLDVLKMFLVTFFPGLGVYLKTGDPLYLALAFIACFFFMYRYYIKLESMFSAYSRDEKYFAKSSEVRVEREKEMDHLYNKKASSVGEMVGILWIKNRTFFFVDEAEFAILLAIFAAFGRVDLYLWVVALAQVLIAIFRVFERGGQLQSNSSKLLEPMRK